MRRYTECNNILVLTELLKLSRAMAVMAIQNQKPLCTLCTLFCCLIKIMKPIKTDFICCPAILTYCECPVA